MKVCEERCEERQRDGRTGTCTSDRHVMKTCTIPVIFSTCVGEKGDPRYPKWKNMSVGNNNQK